MLDFEKIKKIKAWLGNGSINLIGRPFSGKDCQGLRLAEIFEANLIGGGDILRGSHDSKNVRFFIDQGKMLPSDDYINIIEPYFHQERFKNKPIILSAVGRWHGEEPFIMSALESSGHKLKLVINLNIEFNESIKRWKALDLNNDRGNRRDDVIELLKVRQQEFNNKTLPVIDYYRNQNILIDIDGHKTRDEITLDIINSIYDKIFN